MKNFKLKLEKSGKGNIKKESEVLIAIPLAIMEEKEKPPLWKKIQIQMKSLSSVSKIRDFRMTPSPTRKKLSRDGVKQSQRPLQDQNQKLDSLLHLLHPRLRRSQLSRRDAADGNDNLIFDGYKYFLVQSTFPYKRFCLFLLL